MRDKDRIMEVLLVEDNLADVDLTREILADNKINICLNVAMDGESAVEYLYQKGEHKNAVRPDLILLDLNLPVLSGREVLNVIKQDPLLRSIPVVILTTSRDETDIINAYASHANFYINKQIGIEQFSKIINTIVEFWFTVVTLPASKDLKYE